MTDYGKGKKVPARQADPKEQLANYLAQRKQAYAESVLVAFCQNAYITENLHPKEIAARAVELAEAMVEELFVKPMAKAKEEADAVQKGK